WLVESGELREMRSGIAVTTAGDGYDADRGELWFAGETGEAVLLQLDARRRALADEADELAARADGAAREADEASARAAAAAEALAAGTGRAAATVARIQAPLDARIAAADRRSRELGDELRRLAGVEADARRD